MYSKNSSGPKSEPLGTPLVMSFGADKELSTLTVNVLLVNKPDIQSRRRLRIPHYVSLRSRLVGILSKALEKSRLVISKSRPLYTSWVQSLMQESRFVVTDLPGGNPCCWDGIFWCSSQIECGHKQFFPWIYR